MARLRILSLSWNSASNPAFKREQLFLPRFYGGIVPLVFAAINIESKNNYKIYIYIIMLMKLYNCCYWLLLKQLLIYGYFLPA